jgi:hypothetical protein
MPRLSSLIVRAVLTRVVEASVVLLALYAAFSVPMGRRTLSGHVVAVFTTPVAKNAATDIAGAVKRVFSRDQQK